MGAKMQVTWWMATYMRLLATPQEKIQLSDMIGFQSSFFGR